MIAKLLFAFLALIQATEVYASESLVGLWKAVDDANKLVSIIELYVEDSKLHGRIKSIADFDGKHQSPVCSKCTGELKNKAVIGYPFIRDLKLVDGKWVDGRVIDLRPGIGQGTVAHCELQLVDGKARLLGYLFFGLVRGTSTWERVSSGSPLVR